MWRRRRRPVRPLTRTIRKTGAIDDLYKTISRTDDPEKQAEGKKIVEQLGNLKYEVQHDRKLS